MREEWGKEAEERIDRDLDEAASHKKNKESLKKTERMKKDKNCRSQEEKRGK